MGYRGFVEHPARDEMTYLSWVQKLSKNDISSLPTMHRALIYIGILIENIGFDVELGLRIFNIACALLWLLMMYLLGRTIFASSKAGLICLTLAVFNPYMIQISGQIMREPLYLLVFSAGLFCAVQIVLDVGTLCYASLLAPLTVLGIWSRDEGAEMLLLMIGAMIFRGILIRHDSRRSPAGRRLVAAGVLYLLVLGISATLLLHFCPELTTAFRQNALLVYHRII